MAIRYAFRPILVMLGCMAACLRAQGTAGTTHNPSPQPPDQSFAAVSIKAFNDPGRTAFSVDAGGIHILGTTLAQLITYAYQCRADQLSGGETWVRSERFAVEAVTRAPASPGDVRRMLRGVLADRFGLRMAQSSRSTNVLALMVSKEGSKMRALGRGERPAPHAPQAEPDLVSVHETSIRSLVGLLNLLAARNVLRGPVVDETGLSGDYDIWFVTRVVPGPEGRGTVPTAAGLALALRRDLGLRLVPTKAAVETYAITAAHPPTPN